MPPVSLPEIIILILPAIFVPSAHFLQNAEYDSDSRLKDLILKPHSHEVDLWSILSWLRAFCPFQYSGDMTAYKSEEEDEGSTGRTLPRQLLDKQFGELSGNNVGAFL